MPIMIFERFMTFYFNKAFKSYCVVTIQLLATHLKFIAMTDPKRKY
jgi:hypothetical protein